MFLFGAKPGNGISTKTQFIFDVMSCFEKYYDILTQTVMLPTVLDYLKGSDTNIEIVVSSMLQLARVAINCYNVLKSKGLIFVQKELQCEGYEPLIYKDAMVRAEKTKTFFEESMKLENVEICEDFTREEIIEKFDEIQKEADKFEAAHKNDHQAVYGVYIAWFGYYVDL